MKKQKKYTASLTNEKHRNRIAYLFLTPWMLGTIFLALIPTLMCFAFSFTSIKDTIYGYSFTFLGITNYANVLVGNAEVIPAILNFLKTEITYVPIILIMAFIIALILIKDIKGKAFFRTIFFLPVIIISGTLVTIVFESDATQSAEAMAVADPLTSSFIYRVVASYSIKTANFLVELFDHFVIILWLTGIPVILFINALQKINKNMYEAAKIDGANSWQILWKVTIPNVLGIALVCAIFSIVQISTLPVSDLFVLINNALKRADALALACTYSIIYIILILLLIGLFGLVLKPREKDKKEKLYMTYTMKQQLKKTLKEEN